MKNLRESRTIFIEQFMVCYITIKNNSRYI